MDMEIKEGKRKEIEDFLNRTLKEYRDEKKKEANINDKIREQIKIEFVKWLSDLDKKSGLIAGGKGANLAEMWNAKFPVPEAFVVTAQAYQYYIEKTGIEKQIENIIKETNVDDTAQLEKNAEKIRNIIISAEMPNDLKNEIIEAYNILSTKDEDILELKAKNKVLVAIRSSATTEDLEKASFAGQQETYLNIYGEEMLIEHIKKCFASLFTARAIYYRNKQGFKHSEAKIAVVVQRMINSEKSGVVFTINPATNKDEIVIEAVFGLGEGVVSGSIKPDRYVVDKARFKIKDKEINEREKYFRRKLEGGTYIAELPQEKRKIQVLEDEEITRLAIICSEVEKYYGKPQDIEFAIENNKIYIVQTRPITTSWKKIESEEYEGKVILTGIGASSGVASGRVKIIREMKDLDKVEKGDILVTKMTTPDMVVAMQRSSAIVTDEGGMTAHAAIVSREMGIPAVVGTKKATIELYDGQEITVDGTNGKIFEGLAKKKEVEILPIVNTKTKIKVIVDLPEYAERAAKTQARYVGLTRIEGLIAMSRKHPNKYLTENRLDEYTRMLARGLSKIAEYFEEIWVRTSDIRSDEFRNLKGAPEEIEPNPMLGLHGIRAGIKKPKILEAELMAIKEVSEKGHKVGVLIPQIINISEIEFVKNMMNKLGIKAKIGAMIETPAAVEIIEKIAEIVDFVSLGTNDLTQYTLAVDRGNESVQYLYDETHPAILSQIKRVIEACKKKNVETSICGQAGSKKEMVRFLVDCGIDSITVNTDAANEISIFVRDLEREKENISGIDYEKPEEIVVPAETSVEKEPEIKEKISYDAEIIENLEVPEIEKFNSNFNFLGGNMDEQEEWELNFDEKEEENTSYYIEED